MMLLLSFIVLAVPPNANYQRVEAPVESKGKLVIHSHAVPPVGWRRTSRGWEYMTPASYRHAVYVLESKPWFAQVQFMNQPYAPLLISAAMLGLVVFGPGIANLFFQRTSSMRSSATSDQ